MTVVIRVDWWQIEENWWWQYCFVNLILCIHWYEMALMKWHSLSFLVPWQDTMTKRTLVNVWQLSFREWDHDHHGRKHDSRQTGCDTRTWAKHLLLIYKLEGEGETQSGPGKGFWQLKAHPSDKPSSRPQLQILPKQSTSCKPTITGASLMQTTTFQGCLEGSRKVT